MDTSATERESPPSSCLTSRGTLSSLSQTSPHDDKHHFLLQQSQREPVRTISNDYSAVASPRNIEHLHSTNDSFSTSPRSSSSSALQQQNVSLAFASQQLSNSFSDMNIESRTVPLKNAEKPRSRVRELSAPLPSVPPSTPASAISHRSSFSQTQHHHPAMSPSSLRHGSPVFSSPLTELSDSDEVEQEMAELSDSNSVEIISGHVAHPFVPGRKDTGDGPQNVSHSFPTAPSSASPNSSANLGFFAQQAKDLPPHRHDMMPSQSTTPHPWVQESPRSKTPANGNTLQTSTSTNSPAPVSKPRTPPSAKSHRCGDTGSHMTTAPLNLTQVPSAQQIDHDLQSVSDAKHTRDSEEILRTSNVYINGLPPHFPDESLYLMTRDFGNVLSVRTFTRCVGEKMSGYGFVLFDSIDSAERCIETLRKYRNLHPSFSKQVHKIPGTPYASGTITLPPSGSLPSLTSQSTLSTMSTFPSTASSMMSSNNSSSMNLRSPAKKHVRHEDGSISAISSSDFNVKDMKDLTFREKMERLKDDKSTNLYMEGLPLTIDDVSLAALVSPHKIISSRFFQTKLSNPPRMIAFVRLDTRVGAEEVIERLHGRVVRGWNDNGSRISVRFADTNEQRELRRAERMNGGEEEAVNGPQLSMAHAALLNLRGAEAHTRLGNARTRQQLNALRYDQGLPACLPDSHLASSGASHTGYDSGTKDSFLRLNALQNMHDGHGIRSVISQQQFRLAPPSQLRSQPVPTHLSSVHFDSRLTSADAASMLNSNTRAIAQRSFESFSANSLDASQIALLQQQNNLQQLDLLRQMRTGRIDTTYDFENHDQAQLLMPSADIMTNDFHAPISQATLAHVRSGTHERRKSLSQAQQPMGTYNKGALPDPTSSSHIRPCNDEYYNARRVNDDQHSGHQQYATNKSLVSPEINCASNFVRHGVDDGVIDSTAYRRGQDENEVTLISPALTYASRTPSTLSPATPLFNTFGTPASAPATVPRGKTYAREREYARVFRNELRQ